MTTLSASAFSAPQQATLDWYQREAAAYAARSLAADVVPERDAFLQALAAGHGGTLPGLRVLDLGCGPGRDLPVFRALGLAVEGLDGCQALAATAAEHSGCPVRCLRFDQFEDDACWDGIWASASLLHVARRDMADVAGRLFRALKPGGVMLMLVKEGQGEGLGADGRFFAYWQGNELAAVMEGAGLTPCRVWRAEDRQHVAGQSWVNLILRRPAP